MKLLTAEYDYTTETAQVELSHKGKIYKGSAHYKPDEENFPNRFFGQRLAEKRAMVGYWKEQRDINRIKKQALESFKADMLQTIFLNSEKEHLEENEENIFQRLEKHIKYYDKTAKDCVKAIEAQKDDIKKDIQLREQLMKKVKNK